MAGAFAGVLAFEESARASTITVNGVTDSASDNGVCNLREAITAANTDSASGAMAGECAAGAGSDRIEFSIPGAGPHIIAPTTALPQITETAVIDGSTDPGEIVLDGNAVAPPSNGIDISADDSVVRAMTIVRWQFGVWIVNSDDVTVRNSYLGTNENGNATLGNTDAGMIVLGDSPNALIQNNALSANGQDGLRVTNELDDGARIIGNMIGTDDSGAIGLGNSSNGISIQHADNVEIGGTGPGEGNVISNNSSSAVTTSLDANGTEILNNLIGTDVSGDLPMGNGAGVTMSGDIEDTTIDGNVISDSFFNGIQMVSYVVEPYGPSGTVITGNRIGVEKTSDDPLPNGFNGIESLLAGDPALPGTRIGGVGPVNGLDECVGDCNVIANNNSAGVNLSNSAGIGEADRLAVLGNRIVGNNMLGIDLGSNGLTSNDLGDPDTGPNGLQNFPQLRAVQTDGGQTGITGILDSTASTDFRIEVFANETADPSGYGEGQFIVDAFEVSTDGSGTAGFTRLIDVPLAPGVTLSVTATKLDGSGVPESTSEFGLNKGATCDQSGDPGANTLTAFGGGQTLCGLGGDDLLKGNTGGDILDGGDGGDIADLSLSPDGVIAALEQKLVIGASGNDVLFSIENLVGSPFNDVIVGDGGWNLTDGGDGNDTLIPVGGRDVVFGRDGADTIGVADGEADLLVDCGPGIDSVSADPVEIDPASIFFGCETISRPPVVLPPDPPDPPAPTCETDPSLCPDPPDPVVYKCDGKVATIVGTNSGEKLVGTDKRDVIVARGGSDTIFPKAGHDIVCAGDGNDLVKAEEGKDLVYGQDGADKLYGQDDQDTLVGGDGYDYLYGGDSADVLKGGDQKDRLYGQDGKDVLKAGDGPDRLYGGDSADTLKGEAGDKDLLYGQKGYDKLEGGNGKGDVCNGGADKDRRRSPRCEKLKRIP
ncbi:MAG: right-handed parallel beta-helix repeat-containing protein [Solirubrobacterales bacterium]|nr:right-handed parallel beta-helix repeat-containing protein [Solirubrobacterales bacterium]